MNSKAAFFLLAILVLSARTADADPITLSDLNTSFSVDAHSQAGAFSWQVDGTEHLFQEWFWYRTGAVSRERSIDTLTFLSHTASDTDADAGFDQLVLKYRHANFTLEVQYNLTGGASGSGVSTLTETVKITNTRSSGNISFHLFEYSNFDLTNTAGDDTATLVNPSTISQSDVNNVNATVTVVNPAPDHYEIAAVPTTLAALNDNVATDLSDTAPSVGPIDVAFAFQWDEVILPGTTFVISKEKAIEGSMPPIPEPASLLLVGSGLMGLRYWRRRRQVRAAHASS